jgi:hypothetical protein
MLRNGIAFAALILLRKKIALTNIQYFQVLLYGFAGIDEISVLPVLIRLLFS